MPKRESCGVLRCGLPPLDPITAIKASSGRRCTPSTSRDFPRALPNSPPRTHADHVMLAWRPPSRSAQTSNPHSARGAASTQLPATSCLGAFRPPAASARGSIVIPAAENLHRSVHSPKPFISEFVAGLQPSCEQTFEPVWLKQRRR